MCFVSTGTCSATQRRHGFDSTGTCSVEKHRHGFCLDGCHVCRQGTVMDLFRRVLLLPLRVDGYFRAPPRHRHGLVSTGACSATKTQPWNCLNRYFRCFQGTDMESSQRELSLPPTQRHGFVPTGCLDGCLFWHRKNTDMELSLRVLSPVPRH